MHRLLKWTYGSIVTHAYLIIICPGCAGHPKTSVSRRLSSIRSAVINALPAQPLARERTVTLDNCLLTWFPGPNCQGFLFNV